MKLHWFHALLNLFRKKPPEIPEALWQHTLDSLPIFQHLNSAQRIQLKNLSQMFLANKEFTGAHGLKLNDRMLVNIAAQACLPILELGLNAYRGWVGIIVYPNEFVVHRQIMDENGVMHEFDDTLAGEAWEGGPVILSWQDTQQADAAYNVVIHEFAHKLDMLNGETDGIPALHSGLTRETWVSVLDKCYEDFCHRVDAGEATLLDPYAAEHPSEFFAVCSECFFANATGLHEIYPDFYRLLSLYFRQDPARELT